VAINPATPVHVLAELAPALDVALCMTVNPGWGGQPFIVRSPAKVERLRTLLGNRAAGEHLGEAPASPALQVDGGIDPDTAPLCRAAGASLFVAGSAIFSGSDPAAAYQAIARSVDAV
jgi:ribulose-phosphate 3-epimerase